MTPIQQHQFRELLVRGFEMQLMDDVSAQVVFLQRLRAPKYHVFFWRDHALCIAPSKEAKALTKRFPLNQHALRVRVQTSALRPYSVRLMCVTRNGVVLEQLVFNVASKRCVSLLVPLLREFVATYPHHDATDAFPAYNDRYHNRGVVSWYSARTDESSDDDDTDDEDDASPIACEQATVYNPLLDGCTPSSAYRHSVVPL